MESSAPQIGTTPVVGIPVMPEIFGLVLPADGQVRIHIGARLTLLSGQRHIESSGFPVGLDYGNRRDQNTPAAKPAAGFDREVANGPRVIVEIELFDGSQFAIRGTDYKARQMRSFD